MSNRKRKVILQNNTPSSCMLAKRLVDKGYAVMLKFPDSEEIIPFPF